MPSQAGRIGAAVPIRNRLEMTASAGARAYASSVRPLLSRYLQAAGLDVEYQRGAGDRLWYRDGEREVEVLDLVGGFGASLFGHNHPALVARARAFLDAGRVVHGQGSVRTPAGLLGARLAGLAERATGRPFVATFANSGAEAVEAAIKHAEMERRARVDAILRGLSERAHEIRRRLRDRSAQLSEALFSQAARHFGTARESSLDELLYRLYRHAANVLEAQPVFLAVEGAFHGKTSGSVKLTHRLEYQAPWRSIGPRTIFVAAGDGDALSAAVDAARLSYLDLEIEADGAVRLVEREHVNVAACFVEPIQGEGGVRELAPAFLRHAQHMARTCGFPLVVDEIQTGMGRTGRFFASEHSEIAGDYYLLSKALGGSLAKISALLIDRERYQEEFGFVHTSTFAEDDLASEIGLGALDLIEADGGALMQRCAAVGEAFLARLRAVQERFPRQIREVRGRGLMIGVEIADQLDSPSPMLRVLSEQELLGFVLSGYLLREEGVRVAPTLAARATLRLEPSAYVDEADLGRFCGALERLCQILERGDAHSLCRFLVGRAGEPRREPAATETPARVEAAPGAARVAFLAHFLDPANLVDWDPTLAPMSSGDCERFFERTRGVLEPFVAGTAQLRSPLGSAVHCTVIGMPFTPAQVLAGLRAGDGDWARELVHQGVELARRLGCSVVGFGGYTSIVTNGCRTVTASDVALTSGNSLTAVAALEAAFQAAERIGLSRKVMGVVGAVGNIGRALAEVAADRVDELVLVGSGRGARRLERAADELGRATGGRIPIRVAVDFAALRGCNLIVSATNAARPVIFPEHVAEDAPVVVSDVAVPQDVDASVAAQRPRAVVLRGGMVSAPLGQIVEVPGMDLAPGELYGCLGETLLMGLAGVGESLSYGPLDPVTMRRVRELARLHGFRIGENPVDVKGV